MLYAILRSNDIPYDYADKKCIDAVHYINGNGTPNANVIVGGDIYHKEVFTPFLESISKKYNVSLLKESIEKNIIHLRDTFEFEDKVFEKDYWSLSITDLIAKYFSVFPNIEHTPLPSVDDDTPYIEFPSDYIEIKRYWKASNDGRPIKLKDGQGRRRKLYVNALLRRMINPQISFDNLLFNLVWEVYHYISNVGADNIIGKKEIYEIAVNAMKSELRLNASLSWDKRKFMVNRSFCAKYGLSPNTVKGMAKHEILSKNIGELYDASMTDKDNLAFMNEHGLDISLLTLKRWRKEHNITKYGKK